MSKQKRILALWDYNSFTGFATVSKNLMANFVTNLGDSYKMDIVAVNYFGEDYNEGENIRVISAKKNDAAKDDFGRHVFMRSLIDVEYDLIFILQDLGVVVPMVKYMREIREDKIKKKQKPFKSILYFPVDFELTPNLGVGLEFFDYLATYTEYGRKYANAVNKNIAHKLNVIPHGNNPENFFPLEKTKALDFRKEYFGKNADKFIVTNVNRNQSRKDIPNTIFGFLEYWEEVNKNSFLYLHMDENDPMGWNLRTILNQTPLREGVDYSFPPKGTMSKGASVEQMNAIMNSSDVFLTTTVGEGWGLCLHPSTVITTLVGAKPITEVRKGDLVLTHEGLYKEVLDTTSRTVESYIHVKCNYGYEVKATHEHPYLVKTKEDFGFKKFSELKVGDKLCTVSESHAFADRWEITQPNGSISPKYVKEIYSKGDFDGRYFLTEITEISEVFEMAEMYDLCVADSHTFVGNGLVCHNTITEAMACKLPIIAPDHTSVGEICNHGERAFMLKTLYPTVAMVDNVIRFQSDLYEVADTLHLVETYIKTKNIELEQKVESAYAYVNTLGWEKISMEFIKAIRNLTK